MKSFAVIMVLAIAGLVLPRGQAAAGPAIMGVPGYYDPTTQSFVAMVIPKVQPKVAPVLRTGTFKLTVTLKVEAAIGTDEPITCETSITADDASFENSASTSAVVTRSGANGTVVMSIPYSWTMAASGEVASISLNCSESGGFEPGSVGHTIFFTTPGFTVPIAAGFVTTRTLSASM